MISRGTKQAGFTLMEILIVLAIVGTLIATVVRPVMNQFANSKIRTTKLAMAQVAQQLEVYNSDCGKYPNELKFLKEADPECSSWGPNPYLSTIPKDGFNREFIYESDGSQYTIMSFGRDGKEGGTGPDADISPEE